MADFDSAQHLSTLQAGHCSCHAPAQHYCLLRIPPITSSSPTLSLQISSKAKKKPFFSASISKQLATPISVTNNVHEVGIQSLRFFFCYFLSAPRMEEAPAHSELGSGMGDYSAASLELV